MPAESVRHWATPVAVSIHEVPCRTVASVYEEFRRDVMLRLSQTDSKEAILYRFFDATVARAHAHDISGYLRKVKGKGASNVRNRGKELYIWRGKNWG